MDNSENLIRTIPHELVDSAMEGRVVPVENHPPEDNFTKVNNIINYLEDMTLKRSKIIEVF